MNDFIKKLTFLKTLRGRLSLWYFGSTLLVFLILTITLSSLLWITLHNQIDHHLLTVINEARQVVENYRGTEREELLRNLVSTQGMTVVLLSPDGAPLLQTNSPDLAVISEHQIQQVVISGKIAVTEPAHFTAGDVRFAVATVMESGGKGILAVGYSVGIVERTFGQIVLITSLAVVVLLFPISYVGHKILKKNLYPLENIARSAKEITTSRSLSLRVNPGHSTLELKQIAKAFNEMLKRLQNIFKKEHQFFSDAAHALKTPLAVVRTQLENLSSVKSNDKRKLIKSLDDAADVVNDLLFISRIETQGVRKHKKILLSDVMNEFVEITKTLGTEKKLAVKATIASGVSVYADKRLLRRAIGNVIQNAVLYSKRGGKIDITLKRNKKNKGSEVVVRDSGVGISKKDLPRVLDRFYRGKLATRTSGSGLGLAITKAVMDSIGGKIQIKSKIGKFTKVKLIFP